MGGYQIYAAGDIPDEINRQKKNQVEWNQSK